MTLQKGRQRAVCPHYKKGKRFFQIPIFKREFPNKHHMGLPYIFPFSADNSNEIPIAENERIIVADFTRGFLTALCEKKGKRLKNKVSTGSLALRVKRPNP